MIPEKDSNLERVLSKMKGNTRSSVLCLFYSQKKESPDSNELNLAIKIMKAINIGKNDFCWSSDLEIAAHLDKDLNKKYIFIFASGNEKSGLEFPLNEWIKTDQHKVLRSFSLDDLIVDIEKKRQLWDKLSEVKFD